MVAFTGEKGGEKPREDCWSQQSSTPFFGNTSYTAPKNMGPKFPCYDNHPGLDYRADSDGVLAVTDGKIHYPQAEEGTTRALTAQSEAMASVHL